MSDLAVPIDYDNWATEKLVQFCIGLTPEQRSLTTPGTMGTVEATLIHLVGAKERYAAALQGIPPSAEAVRESTTKDLGHVATRAKMLSEWFAGFAREDLDLDRIIERQAADGSTQQMPLSILIAQLLHHGNEHRAQLGSIFGANGIESPHYSAFDWGRERGLLS